MAEGQLGRMINHLRGLAGKDAGEPSDGQLLERFAAAREEASFTALVRRHGGLVLGVCRRVLDDEHDAEDAFQATFLVLAQKAGAIRKGESVGSWLYGVAYRIALRVRSDLARRRACEQEAAAIPPLDPIAEVVWRDVRPVLDEELNRLPARYRDPVVLCYLENKTNGEAARLLGWTRGTVSGRLARARELLRGRLARRGLGLSGGVLVAALAQGTAAAVPPALGSSTVKAAALVAAGSAASAGLVSAPVAAMTEGVLHAMWLTKLKCTAALLVAIVVAGAGLSLVARQVLAGKPAGGTRKAARAAAQLRGNSARPEVKEEAREAEEEIDRLRKENERLKAEIAALRKELAQVKRTAAAQTARERDRAERERQRAVLALRDAQRARDEALRQRKLAQAQAEQARLAELEARKAAEAARRQAEKRLREAEEQRKRAEEARKKAEDEKKEKEKKKDRP
jgi:RNA polymerase sigma factor (sigma-70 family)